MSRNRRRCLSPGHCLSKFKSSAASTVSLYNYVQFRFRIFFFSSPSMDSSTARISANLEELEEKSHDFEESSESSIYFLIWELSPPKRRENRYGFYASEKFRMRPVPVVIRYFSLVRNINQIVSSLRWNIFILQVCLE